MKSNSDYNPPPWSALPSHKFHLEVIKDGSIFGNILLPTKQFILFGKQPDICDVVLENPMISRKHAVLQFRDAEQCPRLYDLQSTHGVYVNNQRLPSRIYHKLNCFDSIQFGGSNKLYLLRCKQLQNQGEEEQQKEQMTQFQMSLNQNQSSMSKQQMKQKYLDLLNNDPYYNSTTQSRGFVGKKQPKEAEGVSWGISDEVQVYNYRNQHQYQLQPDLLRRLPLNDQRIIDRIAELQQVLNKYQEIEGELREIVNKEKKQYGLEDKLRTKKQNLEKRLIQTQEQLEKHQQYIKSNLFGEESVRTTGNEKRVKEVDTFEDDQFYDRTLQKKDQIDLQALRKVNYENNTEDYYSLRQKLEELLAKESQLNKRMIENNKEIVVNEEQMDEYQLYLQESEKKLRMENYQKIKRDININNQLLEIVREKLNQIQPQIMIRPIQYQKEEMDRVQVKIQKKKQEEKAIQKTLDILEKLKKEQEQVQDDKELFRIYEKKQKLKIGMKREREELARAECEESETGRKKKPARLPVEKPDQEGQQYFEDLTKFN